MQAFLFLFFSFVSLFCEDILGTINVKVVKLFQNSSVHQLKALITLERVNTSVKTPMVRL